MSEQGYVTSINCFSGKHASTFPTFSKDISRAQVHRARSRDNHPLQTSSPQPGTSQVSYLANRPQETDGYRYRLVFSEAIREGRAYRSSRRWR